MAIEFKCPCGAVCRADEAKAGELFHCDACGLDLPVPAAGSEAAGSAPKVSVSASAVEEFKAQARDRRGFKDMLAQLHPDKTPADSNVPVAEVVAGPAPSLADEFRAQVGGRDGFNAMMSQLHGIEVPPEAPPAAEGAPGDVTGSPAASAAGSTTAASTAAGLQPAGSGAAGAIAAAGTKARGLAPPAKPVSRAQHHFGFKRVMWLPTLIVAGVCLLASIYAFTLYATAPEQAAVVPPDVVIKEPEIIKDAQGEQWAIPRGSTAAAHEDGTMWSKDAEGREKAALKIVRDDRGRAWAVPAGKTITVSKSGNVFYQDDSGFDVSPESADRWLYIQNQIDQQSDRIKTKKAEREHGALWFGCGLLAVSLVLAGFGIWMRMDVLQARREMAAEAEEAGPDAAAVPARDAAAVPAPDAAAVPGPDAAAVPGPDAAAVPGPDAAAGPGPQPPN